MKALSHSGLNGIKKVWRSPLVPKKSFYPHDEEYLKNEEQCFQISNPKVLSTDFQKKIKNMYTEFDATNQSLYNQLVLSSNEQIDFSLITFNYTNTLDKIIECVSKNCTPFHTHIHNSNTKTDIISAPLHIHGTLDDREMILGINDVSQINNDALRNNVDLADYIVKTNVNRELGQGKIDKAKEFIYLTAIPYMAAIMADYETYGIENLGILLYSISMLSPICSWFFS